jgi:furin
MKLLIILVITTALVANICCGVQTSEVDDREISGEYLNEWTIHVPKGKEVADNFANENGFVNLGEVIPDTNNFHMKLPSMRSKRSIQPAHHVSKRILEHPHVLEVEQQVAKIRTKRDIHAPTIAMMNDPYWDKMWYLNRGNQLDMNVAGAWSEGVTGKGVAVTILDDGIEKDHPDLIRNYDPLASTDINDNDSDPHPRYDFSDSNRHGTRCAGQVHSLRVLHVFSRSVSDNKYLIQFLGGCIAQ